MSRSYAEPAQVRRADELPSEFCWRGRLYSVREVLAHWKEARCWWHEVTADRAVGEREYWRVVAAPGRAFSAGVYELCLDSTDGRWSIASAYD